MQLTLFRGATALLYFGPLLAGLGGAGWPFVPGFLAVFVLFLNIVRPSLFRRMISDWTDPGAWIPLFTQVLVQLLLIVVCFAVGRGLGGVVQSMPPISPYWALALSFLAIPLCRWLAIQPDPSAPASDAASKR
jgi:hypothetical protein